MKKFLQYTTGIFLCMALAMCSSNDDAGDSSPLTDPLKDFYGSYLSTCMGDMQIYAIASKDGTISLAMLAWTQDECKGTYALLDTETDPAETVEAPVAAQTFKYLEVEGMPEDFFVLEMQKVNPDENNATEYSIFYQNSDHLAVLNSYETRHVQWSNWLTEENATQFSANPTTFTFEDKVIHLNRITELPKPIAVLYGNWLSECLDFGGGANIQIFADIHADGFKQAQLKWTEDNCEGTYALYDIEDGATVIAAPKQSQKVTMSHVTGIPDDAFYFIKAVSIADPANVANVVLGMESSEMNTFCELVAFETAFETWADWSALEVLGEKVVKDFVESAPPSSYGPPAGSDLSVFCFNRSPLPTM